MKNLWGRLHNDYLRGDRLAEYRALLSLAEQRSYTVMPVGAFCALRRSGATFTNDSRRIIVMRHDIDTAPRVAPLFAEAEASAGGRGSYFFRLQTIDVPIMRALAAAGHEVGYHYEELATVAKERGVNGKNRLDEILDEARERFVRNLTMLRERTGLPLRVAASHGDFANRALGTSNTLLLADRALRERAGIDLEAYDADVEDCLAFRARDLPYPLEWRSSDTARRDPAAAIRDGVGPILILTHPRQWGRQWYWNAREDLKRTAEGLLFNAGVPQVWRRVWQRT
ncbi:hypothetical protein [Azospirillum sp. sgz301742]